MGNLILSGSPYQSGSISLKPANSNVSGTLILPDVSQALSATLGYLGVPISGFPKSANYTLTAGDVGLMVFVNATGVVITVPDSVFNTGDIVTVVNNTATTMTISTSLLTAYIGGVDTVESSIILNPYGVAKITFLDGTNCIVTGAVTSGVIPLPAIGDPYQGGYFAGQISTTGTGVADYNLVISPKLYEFFSDLQPGPLTNTSETNGFAATTDLAGWGVSAAATVLGASIGGYTDWYIPSYYELEICYYNLKPTTYPNVTSTGANGYAVPPRPSAYTSGDPAQTTAVEFQDVNPQAFETIFSYWASSCIFYPNFPIKNFTDGGDYLSELPSSSHLIRPMRRVPV